MTIEEKKKKLALLNKSFEKKYNSKMIVKGSDVPKVEFYSTGIPSIDAILGGGWAKKRIGSVYGEFSSGKTTHLLQTIAYNQKIDPDFMALYVDQENALDIEYCEKLGIDMERFQVIESDKAEKNLDALRATIEEGFYNIIVIDSTNALVPSTELEKDVSSTASIGTVAKLLSVFTRMVVGMLNKSESKTALICIEQTRDKVGGIVMNGVIPQVIGCGKAVGFYCSQRLEFKKGKPITEGDETIGNTTKVKCVKNKVYTPFAKVEVPMVFGKGFDVEMDNQMFIVDSGIIERINTQKWSYTANNGEVIEIRGQKNIIPTLKEKGLFEEAFENAKQKVFAHTDTKSEYEGIDLEEEQNKEIVVED